MNSMKLKEIREIRPRGYDARRNCKDQPPAAAIPAPLHRHIAKLS
jgi:hypothetical protein